MRQAHNVVVTSGPHTRIAFLVLYLTRIPTDGRLQNNTNDRKHAAKGSWPAVHRPKSLRHTESADL
jgi:hypothetical protein